MCLKEEQNLPEVNQASIGNGCSLFVGNAVLSVPSNVIYIKTCFPIMQKLLKINVKKSGN